MPSASFHWLSVITVYAKKHQIKTPTAEQSCRDQINQTGTIRIKRVRVNWIRPGCFLISTSGKPTQNLKKPAVVVQAGCIVVGRENEKQLRSFPLRHNQILQLLSAFDSFPLLFLVFLEGSWDKKEWRRQARPLTSLQLPVPFSLTFSPKYISTQPTPRLLQCEEKVSDRASYRAPCAAPVRCVPAAPPAVQRLPTPWRNEGNNVFHHSPLHSTPLLYFLYFLLPPSLSTPLRGRSVLPTYSSAPIRLLAPKRGNLHERKSFGTDNSEVMVIKYSIRRAGGRLRPCKDW